MFISGINDIDSINGFGAGVAIFVSGCTHHCDGCFNPETWNFRNGEPFTDKTLNTLIDYVKRPYIDYFSVLGGEPFEEQNIGTVYTIINKVKEARPDIEINIWSGYSFEDLVQRESCKKVLSLCDRLVDGEFKKDLKDLKLKLRGSSNQRIINLKRSLKENNLILDIMN